MRYIIDANNLAGQLDILDEENFDLKLIELIKQWLGDFKHQVFLVFDSLDPMGDKQVLGNLTVIYAPRDNYYQSADDKIIELAEDIGAIPSNKAGKHGSPLQVITNDRDLIKAVKKTSEQNGRNVKFTSTADLAQKLKTNINKVDDSHEDGQRGLSDSQVRQINKELEEIWR